MTTQEIIFRQLFDKKTSTYTYLIADKNTKESALIDPVKESFNRDLKLLEELKLKLKYTLETHVHADHITSSNDFKKMLHSKIALSNDYDITCQDIRLFDYQKLLLGSITIQAIKTPGHTSGCISYLVKDKIFTGDTLLIRATGRTDFQGGSSRKMFNSIQNKIYTLPENTMIYPGHDYNGYTVSTIREEKKYNSRIKINTSLEDFIKTMEQLSLSVPKNINVAVPANQRCGRNKQS